jgi:endonuclease-3 related protein
VASQPHPATIAEGALVRSFPFREYYEALFAARGPQNWWPARTPFEVIVGAILVQNTSWRNVEPAIENLRREKLLTPGAIESVSLPRLEKLIRSSGYFRQKAKKLKAFVHFLRAEYQGSIAKMSRAETHTLRAQLLAVHGIGPETADSILLYAAGHAVFVVDAYTRRILERHGHQLHHTKNGTRRPHGYEDIRQLFERNLPRDAQLFNEFHALIVQTGKLHCRPKNPDCENCALKIFLPTQIAPLLRGMAPPCPSSEHAATSALKTIVTSTSTAAPQRDSAAVCA